ncbi:enoyl-CoA hydratase/isomerase family protein [Gordonia polyisoprenivorans]|uniref:enoyl-CoA hydratase/isomerase family protein n=1 Tax=Gordonia polyisoprenivorans TaxID=84595 RepID=UPI001AD72FF1|nr:enoyl-CoA hydratase/isomerase family protein [Gordonia polyisoprenivorans]QTI69939.1 enoyl-CoA hydratase/isomerase family protein [Gordonia polyisoprenivorans]
MLLVDEPADGVRRLTLNRPDQLNAISRELMTRLLSELRRIEVDESVRAVILRGNGRAFCAGADLSEHFGAEDAMDIGRTDLWSLIENLRVPVIAAVHGWAITGGFLLSYCCDLIVASDDARFRDTHASLGLVPTGGESQRMPRRVGGALARELMLTSRPLPAQEAREAGFVSRVVPRAELDGAALELASMIAANSPRSVREIKMLINVGLTGDFGTGMALELRNNVFGTANNVPNADRDARIAAIRG